MPLRRSPLKLLIQGQPQIQTSYALKTPTSRVITDNYQDVPFTPMHKSGKFEQAMLSTYPSKKSGDSNGSSNSMGMMFNGPQHPLNDEYGTLGSLAGKEFEKDPESLKVKRKNSGWIIGGVVMGIALGIAVGICIWLAILNFGPKK